MNLSFRRTWSIKTAAAATAAGQMRLVTEMWTRGTWNVKCRCGRRWLLKPYTIFGKYHLLDVSVLLAHSSDKAIETVYCISKRVRFFLTCNLLKRCLIRRLGSQVEVTYYTRITVNKVSREARGSLGGLVPQQMRKKYQIRRHQIFFSNSNAPKPAFAALYGSSDGGSQEEGARMTFLQGGGRNLKLRHWW